MNNETTNELYHIQEQIGYFNNQISAFFDLIDQNKDEQISSLTWLLLPIIGKAKEVEDEMKEFIERDQK